jgi:hypothetical protein
MTPTVYLLFFLDFILFFGTVALMFASVKKDLASTESEKASDRQKLPLAFITLITCALANATYYEIRSPNLWRLALCVFLVCLIACVLLSRRKKPN